MPGIMPLNDAQQPRAHIIKFTNCLLAKDNDLVPGDLLINSTTGKIIDGQKAFYEDRLGPEEVIDLKGRILAPGFIDVQINGAYGLDFSIVPEKAKGGIAQYRKDLAMVNKKLIETGVTSYLPTLPTQDCRVYHEVLPELCPTGDARNPKLGAESLGAHCEGPFLSPSHKGCHDPSLMQTPSHGILDVGKCYGWENMKWNLIKMITVAPELPGALDAIRDLHTYFKDIRIAIGHSAATYTEAQAAVRAGATMITHLYNAMTLFQHRNPGIFGVISGPPSSLKPYFGLIADNIHVHPCALNTAFHTHPAGVILVTDAMFLLGLPDGVYRWTSGSHIEKRGNELRLQETGAIAGSCATMIECVRNFVAGTDASVGEAIARATETPAEMLGLGGTKGVLRVGADADLVVLGWNGEDGVGVVLEVEEVWKFGRRVWGGGEVEGDSADEVVEKEGDKTGLEEAFEELEVEKKWE
ncbi:N-acetylglucosamine-6-phosphate deacetylase [Westerdykella ornata]|uniref:N-acetylglucosamine-6-phosphate deacetylase n=1 Tax=Westerdykella ornata TaxID=318751 RepID=A0A6A6JWK6_WESOR|nr:N-acetylglucosamine-6-phosphate deacetylase [Westerdykella ornata]KAF2280198.1 N-acetylglucosamine-6-phosphate deacetylase [Westerdykella ornata]